MISKQELRRIATARLKDAEILLAANRYDGASYLSGYAVEIGLKLRICRTLKWQGFPETNSEFQGLQSLKVHDFEVLLRFSGVEGKIKSGYLTEWSAVKQWKPELRYAIAGSANAASARTMIVAAKKILQIL
ncbi:hypothetical protein [Fibrella arboris]|uniref:hypothetical protein n=1 Tax=Fibrella arboris TaxID=3242486 RepID=UPI003522D7E0